MKKIFFLLLICALTNGYAQTPKLIAHYLGEAKKMVNTTDDLKPLVLVDDTPYTASIANFKAAELTSIRIFDPITAHALFQGAGVHGAIVITTKYRSSVPIDDNSQLTGNSLSGGFDELDTKLAALDPGYKSFVTYHKGNNHIIYRFNGNIMQGDRNAISDIILKIPTADFKFVLTKKITDSHGVSAIVSIRTIK